MQNWRLLDTGFSDCYRNMAIDEAMLIAYSKELIPPTLRIYGWKPSALSIGHSQNPEEELIMPVVEEKGISFVRRMTGGGVIFHDNELTYSIVCSADDLGSLDFLKESYKKICSFIINSYRSLGLDADFAFGKGFHPKNGWFCFSEREKYDIVIGDKKIGGNAQRRLKNAVFQHGSIPLSSSIEAAIVFLKRTPEDLNRRTCNLSQALGRNISFSELRDELILSFKDTFSIDLIKEELSLKEDILAEELIQFKYSNRGWNFSKHADIAKKAHLPAKTGQARVA